MTAAVKAGIAEGAFEMAADERWDVLFAKAAPWMQLTLGNGRALTANS